MITRIKEKLMTHRQQSRVVLHILFWVVVYNFFIYIKKPLLGLPYQEAALFVLKDVVVISIIFYFLSYYAVPHLLFKKKFVLFLLSLVLVYYFYAITVFLEFTFLSDLITESSKGYQSYSDRVRSSGLRGLLLLDNVAEILLDLSYLLSPALIMKLLITLLNLSTQALQLERDNLNLELAFLKSQINPHFLFNTLNNVYSLALHKSDRTADIILKLSDLMRYILYDSNTAQISLGKEVEFFRNYIELERIRHSNRASILFEIRGQYDHLFITPLIIFPFIENAFKHGINASVSHSWVSVTMIVRENTLSVLIRNSIVLKKQTSPKQVGGIGIVNTKKRLELLYPKQHTLEIKEDDASFSINLMLTLK